MTHQLDQYGGIIDLGVDLNAGKPETGQAVPAYATHAQVTTEHPEAHPPGVCGAEEPTGPNVDPAQVLPITVGAWVMLVRTLGHTQQQIERIERQLNLPPLPPT